MAYQGLAQALLVSCPRLHTLALTLNHTWGAAFVSELASARFGPSPPPGPHGLHTLTLRKTAVDDTSLLVLARLFPRLCSLEIRDADPRFFKLSPSSFQAGGGPVFTDLERASIAGCEGVQHSTSLAVLAGGAPLLSASPLLAV